MIKFSIVNYIFVILLFRLLFGLEIYYILYANEISLYFIDNITLFLLCTAALVKFSRNYKIPLYFIAIFSIITFYLFYSFYIDIVPYKAVVSDILQFKPFLIFFFMYYLFEKFSKKQEQFIRYACYINIFIMLAIALIFEGGIMGNKVDVPLTATITGLIYLWVSPQNRRNILIAILTFSIGLTSGRSKMYGFYIVALSVLLFLKRYAKIEFTKKIVVVFIILIPIIVLVAYAKIRWYFIEPSYLTVRPLLYIGAWNILNEYFPFGSGFATYASQASSDYSSPVAYENIPVRFFEENEEFYFMEDVYYPRLAQFGWFGALLFVLFWVRNFKKCSYYCDITKNFINQKIAFLIIAFFAIESVAYFTLVTPQGTTAMMFFAMVLKTEEIKSKTILNQVRFECPA